MGAIQNYFASMAELDNAELNQNTEVANTYVKYANVGAGISGGFEDTKELKPMKYNQAINGPDGEAWKEEIKNESHIQAMHRVMQYCRDTKEQGLTLWPNGVWDGSRDYKFIISGRSDSDYATDPETRKSVTGTRVSVNGAPVSWRSTTQKHISLSVTESESSAGVTCAQDMLYVKNVLESIGLQVALPMVPEMTIMGQ